MWTDDFLQYDWIGSPWWYKDGLNVGNSGFCLQSIKLMRFLADNAANYPITRRYDDQICREYRPRLMQFKWAPENLAAQFAFERSRPAIDSRHFGFHGMFNWPFVLPPAKIAERMAIARKTDYLKNHAMMAELEGIFGRQWARL